MIECKCDTQESIAKEGYVLVPKKQYDKLIRSAIYCRNFAEIAADDWVKETERGYGGTSDAMKTTLRLYDRELFVRANSRVCDLKEEEKANRGDPETESPFTPNYPYPWTTTPGVPILGIKIGDNPGSDPQITCETKE